MNSGMIGTCPKLKNNSSEIIKISNHIINGKKFRMIRSEAQSFLKSYTDRILAAQERRRNRTAIPLWSDSYDAAAACNQQRSTKWDQVDYILQMFGDLTELLLQVRNTRFKRKTYT